MEVLGSEKAVLAPGPQLLGSHIQYSGAYACTSTFKSLDTLFSALCLDSTAKDSLFNLFFSLAFRATKILNHTFSLDILTPTVSFPSSIDLRNILTLLK